MAERRYGEPTRREHRGPEVSFGGVTIEQIAKSFDEIGRIVRANFPAPPDTGYVGNRCGWYPEKPKSKKRR